MTDHDNMAELLARAALWLELPATEGDDGETRRLIRDLRAALATRADLCPYIVPVVRVPAFGTSDEGTSYRHLAGPAAATPEDQP